MRRWIKIAVVVTASIALVATGVALAFDDGGEDDEQSGNAADRITALLEPLVEAGTIDEDQAAAVGEHLADAVAVHPHGGAPGDGRREFSERRFDRFDHGRTVVGTDLADFLGMSLDELREAMAGGASLAAIAEEQGIATGDLVGFLVEPVSERLDDAVAAERITADERQELLAEAEARIADAVERERPAMEPGDCERGRLRPGHGFHHPWHGGGDAPEGTDSSA
jgi:hypothetical protein